jgi:mycothiol system anti-sigma-R factor
VICKELTRYVDAFLDDELSVIENLRVQAHLAFCGNCRAVVKSELSLRSLIEADALQDSAPAHLREKILHQISEMPQLERARARGTSRVRPWAFFAGLFAGAATVGLTLFLTAQLFRRPADNVSPLVAEIVAKHQIYSRDVSTLQIRSSDPIEVSSWLRERLAFPMRLPLLARPGENLVGARLSSIADQQAAYLLYERAGRRISLYIFKVLPVLFSSGSPKSVAGVQFFTSTLGGYPVVWWEDQERYYAAISDRGINDLIEFGVLCVQGRTF